jgi:hypothetical protein
MSWSDCALNPTSCLVENVASAGASATWDSFLNWMTRGLADFSATVFTAFSTSTTPQFDQDWWKSNLNLMVMISLPILVAVFVLQCISAALRREPARLGRALLGSVIGTAGVPLAVAVIAACGKVVDEISIAILGSQVTADKLRSMTDSSVLMTVGTLGGFLFVAIFLMLIALLSLYFVMVLREVALIAFVVFAPIALVSWTWSATGHWLRRWIEIVGALLFSKIAMAVIFALGISAAGTQQPQSTAAMGTFIAGTLLVAMAAFAPLVTFSFIHWAGDQGHAATHAMQQGASGVSAAQEQAGKALQFQAGQFGGSDDNEPISVGGTDSDVSDEVAGDASNFADQPSGSQANDSSVVDGMSASAQSPATASGEGSSAVAVATSQVSVEGSSGDGRSGSPESTQGDDQ